MKPINQKAALTRRGTGFAKASSLLGPRIRQAAETRGFASSRLLTQWDEVVGPEIASMARPLKVSYGRDGLGATLLLLTNGANAPIVSAQVARIRELVNSCYGYNAIARIKITQTAPDASAFQSSGGVKASRPSATAETQNQANAACADIQDENLRGALTNLGAQILTHNS